MSHQEEGHCSRSSLVNWMIEALEYALSTTIMYEACNKKVHGYVNVNEPCLLRDALMSCC